MNISKSMLLMYDPNARFGCPYRYYLQFVKGIKSGPTSAMKLGLQFHAEAAHFFDRVDVTKIKEKSFLPVYNYFRSFFIYKAKMYDYLAELETDRYFVSKEHFRPIMIEKRLDADGRSGKVDRVELLDEGEMMVDELKASKKSSNSMGDVRFELAFYADLLRKNNYNVTYGSVFFALSNRFEIFKFTDWDFILMERRVKRLLECIEEQKFDPVLDERKCFSCPDEIKTICLEGDTNV